MIGIADPTFGPDEQEAVRAVLEDGMVADGPTVREFESEFAAYCGSDHAVATANGTAALQIALEALDVGAGDRVVTTPFSFVASSNAIRLAGATPVFADIDPETYNLDPESARAAVRATDADALLVVHLYGLPADMDAFRDIAASEDVAPGPDLFADIGRPLGVGAERGVVAERAAAHAAGAVAVGAGEAGVDGKLVHPATETVPGVRSERVNESGQLHDRPNNRRTETVSHALRFGLDPYQPPRAGGGGIKPRRAVPINHGKGPYPGPASAAPEPAGKRPADGLYRG
jgi:hypothetical protein